MTKNRLVLVGAACALIGCGLTVDYEAPDGGDAAVGDASAGDGSVGMDAGDAGPDDGGFDAGLDAVVCIDEDGDGVDSCSDCDDSNPDVYPGAPLICGDGVINDCSSGAGDDPACGGLGTYVSEPVGLNTNPGTRALPVATVHQGINNAVTIGGGVDVYVAFGTYRESITMAESHSVLCGYEPTGWTRDINVNTSDITLMTNGGVVFPATTTRDTMIEGCTLRGRSGVSGSQVIGFNAGSDGIARENIIYAGDNSGGQSTGVLVHTEARTITGMRPDNVGATPLVEGNTVYMGISRNGWGNTTQSHGIISWNTQVEIIGNQVFLADYLTIQRAIEVNQSLPGTLIEGNRIRGTGTTDIALTLRIAGGYADVSHNDVYPGACRRACLAVEAVGNLQTVRFFNNVFIGGESATRNSGGLWFDFEGAPSSLLDVLIHSNFLAGGRQGAPAVGLGWSSPGSSPVQVGRVINNVIRAGGGSQGVAMYESATGIDPVLLEHNALWGPPSGAGIAGARLYLDEGATVRRTAAEINALPENVGTSLFDDCGVIDPRPDGDYHLGAGSSCIDAGSNTELPGDDFEYETRPRGAGPDIGPDEAG